jgi:hypothetical protein
MGEAKRKARLAATRSWAPGSIEVEANDQYCFTWKGTKDDAINLQKRYLQAVETWTVVSAESYAQRVGGYLIAFGMPKVGDPDQRPSNIGQMWTEEEIARLKAAVLWMALHEHLPDKPGQRLEDVFVGKSLLVVLRGDKQQILLNTMQELSGQPFTGEESTMMVAVLSDCPLDPATAVTMDFRDLCATSGRPLEPDNALYHDRVRVPRIPIDAAEADAMGRMTTLVTDMSDPKAMAAAMKNNDPNALIHTYCGYTADELRRGKPAVMVR